MLALPASLSTLESWQAIHSSVRKVVGWSQQRWKASQRLVLITSESWVIYPDHLVKLTRGPNDVGKLVGWFKLGWKAGRLIPITSKSYNRVIYPIMLESWVIYLDHLVKLAKGEGDWD
jgi:hypothetical protein